MVQIYEPLCSRAESLLAGAGGEGVIRLPVQHLADPREHLFGTNNKGDDSAAKRLPWTVEGGDTGIWKGNAYNNVPVATIAT